MRSSPFFERMDFIDCSPKTKRKASATLDLPLPFGPTMAAMGEAKRSSVFLPKDLKPESSMDFRLRNIGFHCIKKYRGAGPRVPWRGTLLRYPQFIPHDPPIIPPPPS